MFRKFDTDKSGNIDTGEFQALCFNLGYALSPAEVAMAVKTLDTDGSGHIDENEFCVWWKSGNRWESLQLDEKGLSVRQAAAETFNEVDTSKTGVINTTDFDKFYKILVERKLTTKAKDACLADLDTSGDHKIQFSEYIDWLERIGTISVKVMPVAPGEVKLRTVKTAPGAGAAPAKAPIIPAKAVLKPTATSPKGAAPGPALPAAGQGTFKVELKKTGTKLG